MNTAATNNNTVIFNDMRGLINPADNDQPMIFVTTYSLYNQGRQFANEFTGFWLSCDDFENNSGLINESFNIQDPACFDDHEYMFTDYQNFPSSLYSECSIDFELIEQWAGLDDADKEKINAYLEHVDNDLSEAIEKIDDYYIFDGDRGDYAREICEQCENIPAHLEYYIDYDAMGRDMEIDGNMIEISHNELLIICF